MHRIAPDVLAGCPDLVSAMATAVTLVALHAPELFWVGFYRAAAGEKLIVGPYRGTLACTEIAFGRGVCGLAASTRQSVVVPDVDAFAGHIACDAASKSEIVVPVIHASGALLGVLDADSTRPGEFDDADREALAALCDLVAARASAADLAQGDVVRG
ncbi:GAF domain-containing protein [bacterium]|nr:GAF domain-containing protein [bacterium]